MVELSQVKFGNLDFLDSLHLLKLGVKCGTTFLRNHPLENRSTIFMQLSAPDHRGAPATQNWRKKDISRQNYAEIKYRYLIEENPQESMILRAEGSSRSIDRWVDADSSRG